MRFVAYTFGFLLLALMGITSCQKEIEPTLAPEDSTATDADDYTYSFKAGTLSGVINGRSWSYDTGVYVIGSSGITFSFFDTSLMSTCTLPDYGIDLQFEKVSFVLRDVTDFSSMLKELSYVFNGSDNQTVTLSYNNSEVIEDANGDDIFVTDSVIQTIRCVKGAIQIVSKDIVNNLVIGKIDAYYDDDNHVSGSFTISNTPCE